MRQPFKLRETVELSKLDPRFPAGHVWIFWSNPTQAVISDVRAPMDCAATVGEGKTISAEEMSAAQERFYRGLAELVLDTGETGLDLGTPERVRAIFEDENQDRELIAGIADQYIYCVIQRRIESTKKAIGGLQPTADSPNNSTTE